MTFAGPGKVGAVGASTISELDLTDSVVVLLSCETGVSSRSGPSSAADLGTLATAFTDAGSLGVVATRWVITDEVASEIAELLYANSNQRPSARSVSAVRRALRSREPERSDIWASLVWVSG